MGKVAVILGSRSDSDKIDHRGSVDFKGISPGFKGKSVKVELEVPGWVFDNGKPSASVTLNGNNTTLTVKKEIKIYRLPVLVLDGNGKPLKGVKIRFGEFLKETDINGRYVFEIQSENPQEEKEMFMEKEGYDPRSFFAQPGGGENR